MIELNKCFKLLDDGFSLITVGDNKIPNYSWKKCQSEQISKENFEKQYNYKGGIRKGNGPRSNRCRFKSFLYCQRAERLLGRISIPTKR